MKCFPLKGTLLSGISLALLILPSATASVLSSGRPNPNVIESDILLAQCGGRTRRPRGPLDPLIPYLISPRNTWLLIDRPLLRWNSVAGADRYTVSLLNGETVLWTKEANTNQIVYPEDEAALQPGIDYTLLVKTTDRSSQEDEAEFQSFRLLPSAEAEVVKQAESLLPAEPTTDEAALLKANVYSGVELYSDAIATLEARVAQGTQSAIVYRELGKLYARAELSLLAENRYLQAVTLAEGNLEEQAIVQAALGELYGTIQEDREAVRWLTQAKESYTTLGNQYQVQQLDAQLQQLSGG